MPGLNETKGNMYGFVSHTFNVIKGECPFSCQYCYMKKWGKLKPLRFDQNELRVNIGTGKYIFVGSSCDMFAHEIPDIWITEIFHYLKKYENKYLFQSKNPERIFSFLKNGDMPPNITLATTIETNRDYPQMGKAPIPYIRALSMRDIRESGHETMVTIEPVMDFDIDEFEAMLFDISPSIINIGADSGRNNLPEPPRMKVIELIRRLRKFAQVNEKPNIKRIINN